MQINPKYSPQDEVEFYVRSMGMLSPGAAFSEFAHIVRQSLISGGAITACVPLISSVSDPNHWTWWARRKGIPLVKNWKCVGLGDLAMLNDRVLVVVDVDATPKVMVCGGELEIAGDDAVFALLNTGGYSWAR